MKWFGLILAFVIGGFLIFQAVMRLISKVHPKPLPFRFRWVLERRGENPRKTLEQMGIKPGMRVLEVGGGTGFYTVEAAKLVGSSGKLYCLDIQPEMIAEIDKKIEKYKLTNVETIVGDAAALPFKENHFDLTFLIAVLGEIPDQIGVPKELYRVLKPSGILSITESIDDPHYLLRRTTMKRCHKAGFQLVDKYGNFRKYTLNFRKER